MKHTAIYIRVSSKAQDHASQLPDLERWVAAHDGAVQWHRDKFTGRTMDRPGMEKLLADLRAGLVERIVVWRLDRLGRTTRGLCQLFDELGERKVDLVTCEHVVGCSDDMAQFRQSLICPARAWKGGGGGSIQATPTSTMSTEALPSNCLPLKPDQIPGRRGCLGRLSSRDAEGKPVERKESLSVVGLRWRGRGRMAGEALFSMESDFDQSCGRASLPILARWLG
jgi:hypothetical protein